MKAKQTVYLDANRKPVLAGPEARSVLVREGQEIADAQVAEIEGAEVLILAEGTKAAKNKDTAKELETRDDDKTHGHKGKK